MSTTDIQTSLWGARYVDLDMSQDAAWPALVGPVGVLDEGRKPAASLLSHSSTGSACCRVASDGSWLALSTDRGENCEYTELDIGCGCKFAVFSLDQTSILLIDENDRLWYHTMGRGARTTTRVLLPESLCSEFDTVIACVPSRRQSSPQDAFLIATRQHVVRMRPSNLIGHPHSHDEHTAAMLASVGRFDSELEGCTTFIGQDNEEYLVVQTQKNCYVGQLGDGKAFMALYAEEEEDSDVQFGVSLAMAMNQPGARVAFAMQGKEVHIWDMNMIRSLYIEKGVVDGCCTPCILTGFDSDVMRLCWSVSGRFLATSEASNYTMVWDLDTMMAGAHSDSSQSMVCCYESPEILDQCFHARSDMLAMLGSDGLLSFHGIHPFWKGGVRAPLLSIQVLEDEKITGADVMWHDDGQIYICTPNGVLSWNVAEVLGLDDSGGSVGEGVSDAEDCNTPIRLSLEHVKSKPDDITQHAPSSSYENISNQPMMFMPAIGSPFAASPPVYSPTHSAGYFRGPAYSQVMLEYPSQQLSKGSSSRNMPGYMHDMVSSSSSSSSKMRLPSADSEVPHSPLHHPSDTTVYIGNLPYGIDENSLRWICAKYGTVFDVQKIKDSNSESYGYAFVTFVHPREARHAMAHLNGQYLQGPFGTSRVKVAPSKRKYAKA